MKKQQNIWMIISIILFILLLFSWSRCGISLKDILLGSDIQTQSKYEDTTPIPIPGESPTSSTYVCCEFYDLDKTGDKIIFYAWKYAEDCATIVGDEKCE